MKTIINIVRKKPSMFVVVGIIYIVLVALLKWPLQFSFQVVWFIFGAAIGIYFLNIAEHYFGISPSPFRTVIFQALFVLLSMFIVTSSREAFVVGLVLSLYLQIALLQIGEFRLRGRLNSWYQMVSGEVPRSIQKLIIISYVVIFIIETYIFIL